MTILGVIAALMLILVAFIYGEKRGDAHAPVPGRLTTASTLHFSSRFTAEETLMTSAFQSTVDVDLNLGVPGDIVLDEPSRITPVTLATAARATAFGAFVGQLFQLRQHGGGGGDQGDVDKARRRAATPFPHIATFLAATARREV